jgi:Cu(I)/Ag(I) efflux system membrane protein CusA/SilA
VFGKAGRAETATDPAPLEMFETGEAQPREQWRPGMTGEDLVEGAGSRREDPRPVQHLDSPIRNRIDMLATGIKSPIGVKVTGNDLGVIDRIAAEVEQVAKGIPGVTSSWRSG